ncbi:MAG: polyphosphate kinase 1 [Crocinitomicaceae bacterium]|nr:polyphosphate kinase 1 [Crocinitomicaceae bacterium]|tara:strand:+ start:28059 stop:30113 length:2055 start_codon:yes stop_codon:yes gene_type:complete
MAKQVVERFINRELSWLSFNERVLQEAADSRNPLIERLRFLGIYSNNRDEFFRVRVATVKRRIQLEKKNFDPIEGNPRQLLDKIQSTIIKQQKRFYRIYNEIIKSLRNQHVYLLNETQMNDGQKLFVEDYFTKNVYPELVPIMISNTRKFPTMNDKSVYFAIHMIRKETDKGKYAIVELPTSLPRFVELPTEGRNRFVMMIDDVIRHNLNYLFGMYGYHKVEAYAIKLTRDAEIDLDADVSKSFLEAMQEGVSDRKKGQPVRFVYDEKISPSLLEYLRKRLKLGTSDNMIAGGRYHNFKDFMNFPNIGGRLLEFKKSPPVRHKDLAPFSSVINAVKKKDILLHYPYQTFDHLIDFLREAAIDPKVRSIKMTLYRVAKNSRIINALINAAQNGKDVTVLVELQARFDEENNIKFANLLSDEGIKVLFGYRGLKVHSKVCYISRREENKLVGYVHVGTGNFHESTAKIYGDLSLLTRNSDITDEVRRMFELLEGNFTPYYYKHLLVSPLNMRPRLVRMINQEIRNAQAGKNAYIHLKLNNIIDPDLMEKLYQASKAGVEVKINIRGICGIRPGMKNLSENIEAISILGKYLEHARIMIFCNNDDPKYFIGSADWMERNLDRRIEVTCPIYDKNIQDELRFIFDLQWKDNVKARQIDANSKNEYRKTGKKANTRAQMEFYKYYSENQ